MSAMMRLRKPIRKRMWVKSQGPARRGSARRLGSRSRRWRRPADGRQLAGVHVAERQRRLAAQGALDVAGRVHATRSWRREPHRGWGRRRTFARRQVADHADLRVAGDGQVGLDGDAAGAVERDARAAAASGEAATPAAQTTVRQADALAAERHAARRRCRSPGRRSRTSTPRRSSCRAAFADSSGT